jgi:hypothetical protein
MAGSGQRLKPPNPAVAGFRSSSWIVRPRDVADARICHTGESRYGRLCQGVNFGTWIPAYAGMTNMAA